MTLSRLLHISRHRARSLFSKGQVDAELSQEVAFHFNQLVDEFAARGLLPDEAARAARRAFGSLTLLEDQARDARRVTWAHDFWQDLLFGVRMLRKSRGFAAVAVASLALGIGANAAVIGAMQQLVMGGLSFPDADRLVNIRAFPLDDPQRSRNASVPDYFAWQSRSRSFVFMGASLPEQKDLGAGANGTAAERLSGQGFTPAVFHALGVQPALGRVFTEAEAQIGQPAPVIVISHRFWQRHFRGIANVLNAPVRLNGVTTTVIGVMPADFRYPNDNVDYWVPLALNEFQPGGAARFMTVIARLKPGVTIEQAQADLAGVSTQLGVEFPDRQAWGGRVVPLHDALLGWTRQPLLIFEAAVLLVLLIACANLAGLLLARGSVRRSEIAVRMALGAGRERIVRQFVTEGLLLSAVGGALSVPVAWFGLRALVAMSPPIGGIKIGELGLNATMIMVTAALSAVTGLVSGLTPALTAFNLNLTGSLKESVRGTGTHAHGQRLRGALVAAQIALALVLLTGTGLLLRSVLHLVERDLNFEPHRLLTFEVRLPAADRPTAGIDRDGAGRGAAQSPSLTMATLYDGLRAIPHAESVAGVSSPPVNSLLVPTLVVHVEGRPKPVTGADRAAAATRYFLVTPNFFATMNARLVRGREFTERDTAVAPWVAVVNETAARRFWPDEDPIGKRFTLDVVSGERPREVVGVVRDIPLRSAFFDADPVIYTSYLQQSADFRGPFVNMFGQATFLIRHDGDYAPLVPAARRVLAELDPDRALARVMPMDWYIVGGWWQRGTSAVVLGVFACVAMLLAAIGVYGVMAYSVAQRTREIGIRIALGAGPADVVALVGRSVLLLISAGLVLGAAGSLVFGRLIASQLWEVTPSDPATYAGVSLLLVFVALVAGCVPLRRALRVDPTVALRYE